MKRRSRLLLAFALCLLSLLLGAGALFLAGEEPRPAQRLPDGSLLVLEGVTYGKQHTLALGPRWGKLLFALTSGRQTFGVRTFGSSTANDTLIVWVRKQGGPPLAAWRVDFGLKDEHGCKFFPFGSIQYRAGSMPSARDCLQAAQFQNFPRRGATLSLDVLDPRAKGALGVLTAPNPVPGPYPEWKTAPPPLTQASGNALFKLATMERIAASQVAVFRAVEQGRPTAEWEPVGIVTSDATGNATTSYPRRGARDSWLWPTGLCPHEPAWKLRTTFARTAKAQAKADMLWTSPPVSPPAGGGSARLLSQPAIQNGITLELQKVVQPRHYDKRAPLRERPPPFALVRVVSPGGPVRLTLTQVTDGAGRVYRPHLEPGSRDSRGTSSQLCFEGRSLRQFRLPTPPGARDLRLTFAAYRTRTVEYVVRPEP